MSTTKINFNQLPVADEVKNNDYFVIDDEVVTKRVQFTNIVFGLDNVTFASTISAHSTEISTLSSDVTTLSGELYQESDILTSLITTTVQAATGSLVNLLYPIGSIKYTVANVSPSVTLPGTGWIQISQGRYIAGVGTGTDANSNIFEVRERVVGTNTTDTEYTHTLTTAEIPAHSHSIKPLYNGNADGNDTFKDEGTPRTVPGSTSTYFNATENAGGGGAHNNKPPVYGLYVWERVS